MSKARAVFFLRSYNDTDHLTPVVWKWATATGHPATVVLRTGKESYKDYRIRFLASLPGVTVRHISELFPQGVPLNSDDAVDAAPPKPPLLERIVGRGRRILGMPELKTDLKSPLERGKIQHMLDMLFADDEKGIIVFDWVSLSSMNRAFAEVTIEAARERGIANIALPHGDSPYFNKMFKLNDINYDSVEHFGNVPTDVVVVPNLLTAERYTPYRDETRLKILGSARYNQEWMDVLKGIQPTFADPASDGKLKLILFLRNSVFPIFWEEVITAVRICTQFPDVYLVIKHHTRGGRPGSRHMRDHIELNKLNTMKAGNLKIVYNDVHSGSLLEWADAVLDLGTSISFETLRLNKPLLSLEYLHANLSTVAHYVPSTALHYKDQLYDEIAALRAEPTRRRYSEADRTRFLAQIVDYPDEHVLQRYVNELLEQIG